MLARVKVGHERRNVLRRRQPRVHVGPGVEEAPGGDRDVGDLLSKLLRLSTYSWILLTSLLPPMLGLCL